MRAFLLCLLVCLCLFLPTTSLVPRVAQVTRAEGSLVLLAQATSTRAAALESPSMKREPFSPTSRDAPDGRNRIILFANNLTLLPGEGPSSVRATAEDNFQQLHNLAVEYVGQVPDLPQLTQIIVRLGPTLTNDTGDVLMQITYHGMVSNKVRVGIGHIGDGPNVIEFDGDYKSVDYGLFWQLGELGHFFWEFWAMVGPNASERYLLSDGYGGAHAILFGVSAETPTTYFFNGNTWDGTGSVGFASDEGPTLNEWGHFAVGWDGIDIVTYLNGVPVGRTPFTGPRSESGGQNGGGNLLIGGSDHQNFSGRIWQMRGFENANPHESADGVRTSLSAFVPQTMFEGNGAAVISSYTRPTLLVADRSGNNHVGRVRSTVCGIPPGDCPGNPLPEFVVDSTAPNVRPSQPQASLVNPSPMPPGARVFDSFSRAHSTYAFDGVGGLDMTEGGSAGRQVWQYSPATAENGLLPFGILNGRAVVLANRLSTAWVSTGNGPANLDIRVNRRYWSARSGNGISSGLVFRFRDLDHFFYAYTSGDAAANQTLKVGYVNGSKVSRVLVSDLPMPGDWTLLRVVTRETGDIEIYADTNLWFSTRISALATEKKAGLWNAGAGRGLANRWDNFTVLDAP